MSFKIESGVWLPAFNVLMYTYTASSVNFNDPVEIATDGKTVIVSPVAASDRKARVVAARAKVNAKHKKAFEKLAE